MSKNEIFDHEESERYEADNLKPFLEILRDKVNSKDTKVMAMFSQLIKLSERVIEYTDKLQQEGDNGAAEAAVNLRIENEVLHRRLGDKSVCDKCGGDVMLSDCIAVCGKCEEARPQEEKDADGYEPNFANWHWKEINWTEYSLV